MPNPKHKTICFIKQAIHYQLNILIMQMTYYLKISNETEIHGKC